MDDDGDDKILPFQVVHNSDEDFERAIMRQLKGFFVFLPDFELEWTLNKLDEEGLSNSDYYKLLWEAKYGSKT